MWQELELEKFVTHEVPFLEINKGFEYMIPGDNLQCITRKDAFNLIKMIEHLRVYIIEAIKRSLIIETDWLAAGLFGVKSCFTWPV